MMSCSTLAFVVAVLCCLGVRIAAGQDNSALLLNRVAVREESSCNATTGCKTPPIGDLILGRQVYASNTCGQRSRQEYCSFVTATDCKFCDSSNPDEKHTADLLTDSQVGRAAEDWQWWQSEPGVENVELRMDFGGMFHLSHVTMNWKSVRPRCMAIERSVDFGRTWHAYQYFAQSCEECFGVQESFGPVPHDQRGNGTILPARCTTRYSAQKPTELGQVAFVPLDSLFLGERNDSYLPAVKHIRQLTNLRLRFTKLHTGDGGDVASMSAEDQRQYYFAIYNLIVKGNCFCNGHADQCGPTDRQRSSLNVPADQIPVYSKCVCRHNAHGEDCSQCQPLFNDLPWRPGRKTQPNVCQKCQCHGFAESCHFGVDRFAETSGQSGGVCDQCSHNRQGAQCHECVDQYYFQQSAALSDPTACQLCTCLPAGSVPQLCHKTGAVAGQCMCKANVQGEFCGQCKPGFYNLDAANPDGCQECDCDPNGTASGGMICHAMSGQCECKANVEGRHCDRCNDGFSALSAADPDGCGSCLCNVGGALGSQCDPATRQCQCRPGIIGQHCDQVPEGRYFSGLQRLNFYEAEAGQLSRPARLATDGNASRGQWVQLPAGGSVELVISDIKWTMPYAVVLNLGPMKLHGGGSGIKISIVADSGTSTGAPSTASAGSDADPGSITCRDQPDGTAGVTAVMASAGDGGTNQLATFDDKVCLRKGVTYRLIVTREGGGSGSSSPVFVDSISLLPTGSSMFRNIIDSFTLDDCSAMRSGDLTAAQSDACAQHEFAVSAILNNGTLACDCDPVGSTGTVCSEYNGQCDCLPGVGGRRCDICQAYHYQFSNTGCTACNCSAFGAETPVCLAFGGQCPCLINTVGRTCAECRPNHYPAKDLLLAIGCLPCACHELGSLNLACAASGNATEGHQCACKPGVTGALCDRCTAGFWNFGARGCEPCACSPAGAVSSECDLLTGACRAKANVMGAKADRCKPGYLHLQAENPDGCIRCFCNGQSDTCRASTLYQSAVVESISLDPAWGWNMSIGDAILPAHAAYLKPGDDVTFLAPANYLGDVRTAFSQSLTFALEHNITQLPTIITVSLERRLAPAHSLYYEIPMSVETNYEVRLLRHGWRLSSSTGPVAADVDLRQALASLAAMKISVSIPQDADNKVRMVSLEAVSMTYATKGDSPAGSGAVGSEVNSGSGLALGSGTSFGDSTLDSATWVEQCLCPAGYQGDHCEECAGGFTREPSYGTEFDMCLQCFDLCRQLSSEHCDVDSGECRGCANHTAGAYCQQCQPHHFRRQLMEGCLECPCPGAGLQFSDSCELTGDGYNATCSCISGHVGDNCEECAMGHYGMPVSSGAECQACSCNNNTDPAELDFCDRQTGVCLDCLHNTGGAVCGRCADGFYGDALRRTCRPCDCDQDGSNSSVCHYETGQCQCHANTVNRQCSECSPGHYGLAGGQGCKACNCCTSGSSHEQCDLISGLCPCLAGVGGRQCCSCEDEFWDFPSADQDAMESPSLSGCKACNCSVGGSLSPACDKATGTCQCQPASTGHKCDSCSVGTYGPPDCIHCGQCFDDWNVTVIDVAAQIRDVGTRARLLREGGFADTYSDTFDAIRRELLFTKRYLDASYLNETLVSAVEMERAKLAADIAELSRDIAVAKNASIEESARAASLATRFQDLNATVLKETEEQIEEITRILRSFPVIPFVPQIAAQRARRASNELKDGMEQLDLPVADGGQLLSESIRQLGRINATLSSPAYKALYARNAEELGDLDGRYLRMLESLAELDRSICGSDSREDRDACSAASSCGGLRCAVCATVTDGCLSAADNGSLAVGLAASTLAAVADRNRVIQALADSITALAGNVRAANTSVRTIVRDVPAVWKNASDLFKLAMARRGEIELQAGSASDRRAALLSTLASLKVPLTNPEDTAAEMTSIIADIRQRLSGIEDSEVEQIMTDTESALAFAKLLYTNATAVNDEAHAALLIALQMEVVLRQADAIQQDVSALVRHLNATAIGIGQTHSNSSAALSRIANLTRDAGADLSRTLSLMTRVEMTYSNTSTDLSSIESRQAMLAQESSNVTRMVDDLSSRSGEVRAVLAANAERVTRRLAMSVNMSNEADALRREMDSFHNRAETVYNKTLQHRRTLDNIDTEVLTLLDDLDMAVASIARKDDYQTTCQFGQP